MLAGIAALVLAWPVGLLDIEGAWLLWLVFTGLGGAMIGRSLELMAESNRK